MRADDSTAEHKCSYLTKARGIRVESGMLPHKDAVELRSGRYASPGIFTRWAQSGSRVSATAWRSLGDFSSGGRLAFDLNSGVEVSGTIEN